MDAAALEKYRRRLGVTGAWSQHLMWLDIPLERSAVRRIEALGYGSVWSGELIGSKDVFAHTAAVLSSTSRIVYGAGVANVWARHAHTMEAGRATISAAWPERFVLGVGISHERFVEASGQRYARPLDQLTSYVQDMKAARGFPRPQQEAPLVLAALGPRMLERARDLADGAHTYLVTPDHTAQARATLGPDRLLIPAQAVVLCSDRAEGRRIAHEFVAGYLGLPNYVASLRRLGFDDADLVNGGSERLVDALVAYGDEQRVLDRVKEVRAAGADHVLVQPLGPDMSNVIWQLEHLASPLMDLVTSEPRSARH